VLVAKHQKEKENKWVQIQTQKKLKNSFAAVYATRAADYATRAASADEYKWQADLLRTLISVSNFTLEQK